MRTTVCPCQLDTLTNTHIMRVMLTIDERDQDIVASRVKLETLASIGLRHGITRENVRQRWEKVATKADRAALKKAIEKKAAARMASRVKPERVKMARLHVLVPGAATINGDQVVVTLAEWVRGQMTKPPKSPRGGERLDLYLSAELKRQVAELCAQHGVTVSDAVRYAASKSARNTK